MRNKNKEQKNKGPSFRQMFAALPKPLMERCIGQFFAALLVTVLSVVFMLYFKTFQFCIGFLIALYLAYIAMSIMWKCTEGKIECCRMVCIKAQRKLRVGRVSVIMKDEKADEFTNENTRKYDIVTSGKKAALITAQTVMDLYINPDNPTEVIAWEIVGNYGST